MTEREFAIDVVRRLRQAGHEALWAGGCVRDELLGLVAGRLRRRHLRPAGGSDRRCSAARSRSGPASASSRCIGPRRPDGTHPKVQVATFRSDGAYIDGRRPESVVFSSAEEDAQRRDFTINGMFFDPLDGQVIDYVGGQADLQRRRPAGDRRPAGPVPRGQAAAAAGRPLGRPLRLPDRAGHRGRDPRDGRRRSRSSAPSASPTSCARCSSTRSGPGRCGSWTSWACCGTSCRKSRPR